MAKLRAEIAQKGLCEPIIVRSRGDAYEIVDGEHRWRTCRDLGISKIPCIIQDYDDNEAKIKTLQLNYLRGSVIPIKLAALIHDLNKEIKLEDLAKRLPYEEPQLLDNLELLKLPEGFGDDLEEQAKVAEEEMPSVHTFVLFKEQREVLEEALKMASEAIPEGTKNSKAIALKEICIYFLMSKGVKELNQASGAEIPEP
jgi:ParB/RepB/Spo0J family partition protein